MDDREIERTIEGILFASGDSVPVERIANVIGVTAAEIIERAQVLADYYTFEQRGIRLVRLGDSLQLTSAPEQGDFITRILETRRPPRLSASALEVLAIAAYFQPVTRAYIDSVRGVDSSYTVGMLAERGLLEPCGKLDAPGRPTLFRTSESFLRVMGISALEELPDLPNPGSVDGMEQIQAAIDELSLRNESEQLEIEVAGK